MREGNRAEEPSLFLSIILSRTLNKDQCLKNQLYLMDKKKSGHRSSVVLGKTDFLGLDAN